jgi:hypothetical protein
MSKSSRNTLDYGVNRQSKRKPHWFPLLEKVPSSPHRKNGLVFRFLAHSTFHSRTWRDVYAQCLAYSPVHPLASSLLPSYSWCLWQNLYYSHIPSHSLPYMSDTPLCRCGEVPVEETTDQSRTYWRDFECHRCPFWLAEYAHASCFVYRASDWSCAFSHT